MPEDRKLKIRFAGRLIDLLGQQMYGGPVQSVAELVANAWDADAEKVEITIPEILGENAEIIVKDFGKGMTFDELNECYLHIGYERRKIRGERTDTTVITKDIRKVSIAEIKRKLNGKKIHLLAGCPPCQGFSSIRRLNRANPIEDERNNLIMEYIRIVKALKPYTIMMENVPGLVNYNLFKEALVILKKAGYKWIDFKVVNVKNYGVPQSRRRLVLVGSRLGEIKVAKPINEKKTVRQTIGNLPIPEESNDPLHKIFPTHEPHIQKRIEMTPKNGGSRKDLPEEYLLKCHKAKNIGFNDVYGRLRWDDYSTTITGGCLNPSKGRFLHPEQNRCISAREAALLQSFPPDYKFPISIPRSNLALLIGNALPPNFSYIQSENIKQHLMCHLD